ncbi:SDR family NAD(P)-dependent oxidoreductase [Nesterenkonia muleiensis]|uniref:SDR family NAD(P)-dependent oxidoreductase n=1 Tax=Nesterenkonia muleiensis TaxID=2282648 RepID=UPI001EE3A4C8|nr:SDR family NAD(P)-dependent oxidoreductase [Nesterenkonia muleiensis]
MTAEGMDRTLHTVRLTDASQMPAQTGRTWLVTGATHGVGQQVAQAAVRAGARLILPARDLARGQELAARARQAGGAVQLLPLDLTEPDSIEQFAAAVEGPVDVLVNNAGAVTPRRRETANGQELILATNFLGPFALTDRLREKLISRVVIVGSDAHRSGVVNAADPHFRHRRWSVAAAYAQSKLCTMLWARALQGRLTDVSVQLAHPGWAFTNIQNVTGHRLLDAAVSAVCRPIAQSAAEGALPVLAAAVSPLNPLSYVGPDGFRALRGKPTLQKPSSLAQDDDAAEAVWQLGVRETGTCGDD